MRWPWSRPPQPRPPAEADRALAESTQRLHQAQRQVGLVDRLVAQLGREGQVNHFQARIAAAFREHR